MTALLPMATEREKVIDDGGPAFPRPLSKLTSEEVSPDQEGMSLRDYFAAHAPTKPQPWFEPDFPPKPDPVYDHEHPNAPWCSYDNCSPTNWQERMHWSRDRSYALSLQWPYAWADAQLAERAK